MSIVYDVALVLILKLICWPAFTLMSVAKPWMSSSPAPLMSHTLGSVPVLLFSHAITLTGAEHGSAASALIAGMTAQAAVATVSTANRISRRRVRAETALTLIYFSKT